MPFWEPILEKAFLLFALFCAFLRIIAPQEMLKKLFVNSKKSRVV